MGGSGHFTWLHFAPSRNIGTMGSVAPAVERVFLGRTGTGSNEVGSVAIRVESDQIVRVALRTLHAMANPSRHLSFVFAWFVPVARHLTGRMTKEVEFIADLHRAVTSRAVGVMRSSATGREQSQDRHHRI